MADDKPEDAGLAPDTGRARRAPPTIDLEATEVSTQPQDVASVAEAEPQGGSDQVTPETGSEGEPEVAPGRVEVEAVPPGNDSPPDSPPVSPWVIAPLSGAVAAALVIAVGWMLGWPAVQGPPAAPQVTAATVDALSGRLANVEAKLNKPAAPAADPAIVARIDTLDKSLAAMRAQSDKLAGAMNEMQSAPRDAGAAGDLSAIDARLSQLERAAKAERTERVQQGQKIADAKPVDDSPLRLVVAAALLDVAVRHGDAYAAQLAAAKSLASDPAELTPLDAFASSGVPNPIMLDRELLNIVPKLSPPAEAQTSGTGIVERLQAGASKLVRIERTDAVGNDRGAIVARVTAAALRNDFNDARRELKMLPEAERAPAQAWLDKADARDAALAASRKFADEAMANLAKPAQ